MIMTGISEDQEEQEVEQQIFENESEEVQEGTDENEGVPINSVVGSSSD